MAIIKHSRTTSTNDSDAVVLTAGSNSTIELLAVQVVYTSTATAGSRTVSLRIQDHTDTAVLDLVSRVTQAATNTYTYWYAQGNVRETGATNNGTMQALPSGSVLLPGWDLRVLDTAAIDAAADDMVIDVIYRETPNTDTDMVD